jgi:transcriptional regulator with XRE-family HTH domain
MPQLVSSMLRRLELGNALRRLREERHMTIADVTAAMKERFGSSFSTAKLSRMETAKRGVIPRDVHDLCDLYGVPEEVREQLMELAKEAREQDELAEQPELRGLSRYSAIERIATRAREYSSMYLPRTRKSSSRPGCAARSCWRTRRACGCTRSWTRTS